LSPADPYRRIRIRKTLFRLGLLALLLGGGGILWWLRRPPEGLSEAIDAVVEDGLEEGPIAGATVAVSRGGRTLHSAGYGYADLENRIPATENTLYHVGSITKEFTAAAVLLLVEEGRVELDRPITEYLPDLPSQLEAVEVRHLLNHTGGVRNYTTMESWWRRAALEVTPSELVEVFAHEPLDFPPRTEFSYSNSGYVLLGLLVERVSGQPFGGFLNEQLFVPLGLERTHYCDDRALVPERARGYQVEEGAFARARYVSLSQAYAAGGICSTAPDLLRWTRLLMNGAVVRPEAVRRMIRPDTLADGRRLEYAYGIAVGNLDGRRRLGHVGGMRGFASFLAHYPEDALTVVVLTNTEGAPAAALESEIARLALRLEPARVRDVALSEEELNEYTGTYDLRLARVDVEVREERLRATVADPGIDDVDLRYQGDDTFVAVGDPEVRVRFEREGEVVTGFVLEHHGITLRGRREARPDPGAPGSGPPSAGSRGAAGG